MFKWKKKSGRLTRWLLYLAYYDFEIKYQRGSLNRADFLSRIEESTSQSNLDDCYSREVIANTQSDKYIIIAFIQGPVLHCGAITQQSADIPAIAHKKVTLYISELSVPNNTMIRQ